MIASFNFQSKTKEFIFEIHFEIDKEIIFETDEEIRIQVLVEIFNTSYYNETPVGNEVLPWET